MNKRMPRIPKERPRQEGIGAAHPSAGPWNEQEERFGSETE
jgi:hypothetical protein